MVDLSKTEDRAVETSLGPLNLEANEQTGNGQGDHADVGRSSAVGLHRGKHPGARGNRGGPAAPGDVYR